MILFFQNPPDLFLQRRDINHDNPPEFQGIDRKIVVNRNIPEPDDFTPRYIRILPPRFFRNSAGCFAEDLEMMYNPYLDQFTSFKCRFSLELRIFQYD